MRKTLLIALSLTLTITMVKAQAPATIRLTDVTLMHEMRDQPFRKIKPSSTTGLYRSNGRSLPTSRRKTAS